jgi:hypothetical protein
MALRCVPVDLIHGMFDGSELWPIRALNCGQVVLVCGVIWLRDVIAML